MPQLVWSRAVLTGAVDTPIGALSWQYEYLPWPAHCFLMQRTTAVGFNMTVYSGSETIAEEQPIQSGGTAGVTPSPLNTMPLEWVAAAGDRLKINNRNTTGGTLTVDGLLIVNPVG
jgi:hypothetical protein